MPLKIWLQSKYDLPLIGNNLLQMKWVHYAMSWGGMLYDLSIPFLLMIKRTRVIAFLLVIFFHVFTLVLFPIGMFPHIMIFSSMIFFSWKFHKKIIDIICSLIKLNNKPDLISIEFYDSNYKKIKLIIVSIFFLLQLFPFRYQLYPGELFWHEQGYRFSWQVMLIEKIGYTNFKIFDPETSSSFMVDSSEYLTPVQEKQMSFQPDFILEFSHFLGKKFSSKSKELKYMLTALLL